MFPEVVIAFLLPVAFLPFISDVWAAPKATLLWCAIPLFFIRSGRYSRIDKSHLLEILPVFLWFAVNVVGFFVSPSKSVAFLGNYGYYFGGLLSTFSGLCLFFLTKNYSDNLQEKILLYFASGLFLSILAGIFLQFPGRISGTFGNPNFLGGVISMTLPALIVLEKTALLRIVLTVGLLLTFSRASWVGFAGSFVFIFLIDRKKSLKFLRDIALILLVCGIFFPKTSVDILGRFFSIFDLNEPDIVSRFDGYKASWQIFLKAPFLGNGTESFLIFFRRFAPEVFVKKIGTLAHAGYPHCFPLQILVEFGIVGFLCYAALIFAAVKKAATSASLLKKAAAVGIVAHVFTNFFAFPSVSEIFLFWFFLGVIFSRNFPVSARPTVLKKIFFVVFSAFIIQPVLSDFFFTGAQKAQTPEEFKSYASKITFPSDVHLMKLGRKSLDFWWNLNDPEALEWGRRYFEKAVRRNPHSALAFNGLGVYYMERFLSGEKEFFVFSQKNFYKAIECDPYLAASYINLARLFEKNFDFENALDIYEKLLTIYPQNQIALFNAGVCAANLSQPQKALKFWRLLEKINPSYPRLKQYIEKIQQMS